MKPDFDRWLDYHSNAYPGFARWVSENKAQIEHMRRLLGHFGVDQLQQATDTLYGADEQPNGYSNHARAIRRLCNPQAQNATSAMAGPTVIDGRLVASCARCMDYGVVEVLTAKCLQALWAGQDCDPHPVLTTCMIACDCQLGTNMARRVKLPQWVDGHALIRYETVLDRAITEQKEHASIFHAQWEVARRWLQEHHDAHRVPQALSGEVLP